MTTASPKHLLIVDDDPRIRGLLSEALGALGYATSQAGNGREALEMVYHHDYDCVITDIRMPEIDGLTLLQALKAQKPELPVVMITAFAVPQHKAEAVESGADGFLMKPFRLSKIEDVLERVLGHANSNGHAKRPIRAVLVVDDDPEFRILLLEVLEAMRYNVESAGSAEEALTHIEHHCPDAIIVDYRLPGMSGETLVKTIKGLHPELPVIMISGYAPSLSGREYADGAADAFLMKPFRIDRIGDVLRSLEATER
ncbi:MAG TPA: response regulator [bacterium]|nr:response regulator [bacterium]